MERKDLDKERQNRKTLVLYGVLVGGIGQSSMVMFFEREFGFGFRKFSFGRRQVEEEPGGERGGVRKSSR